jgi:amino acid transporter
MNKESGEGLKREIGLWGLSANMVNIIIGSGIFVLPAIIAGILGPASVLAYLFCGLLIILIMLCYAEAGSKITKSGGSYAYVETAFGEYFGFLVFITLFISTVCAVAAVANALFETITSFFPALHSGIIRIAFLLLLFGGLIWINIRGVRQGVGTVKLLTLAKLLPLILLIVFGLLQLKADNLKWHSIPGLGSIGEASLILFFAYLGGETGLSVGGEIKNPARTVPRAVIISIVFVILFYTAIQTIAQSVLGASLASEIAAPLAATGKVLFGVFGFTFILLGTSVSMLGNLSGQVLNNPRNLFAISRDRIIPVKAFSVVHKKYATPYIAIIVYASLCLLFAIFGGFQVLAVLSVAGALLVYLAVAIAVLKLRKIPEMRSKGITIPGGALVPVLSALICLFFLYHLKAKELISITAFLAISTFLYWGLSRIKNN